MSILCSNPKIKRSLCSFYSRPREESKCLYSGFYVIFEAKDNWGWNRSIIGILLFFWWIANSSVVCTRCKANFWLVNTHMKIWWKQQGVSRMPFSVILFTRSSFSWSIYSFYLHFCCWIQSGIQNRAVFLLIELLCLEGRKTQNRSIT